LVIVDPNPSNTAGPLKEALFEANTLFVNVVSESAANIAPPPPFVATLSKNTEL